MTSGKTWLKRILGTERAPEALARDARQREEAGDLFAARALLEELLARHPGDVEALKRLGRLADRERRHDEAVELLRRAVGLAPGDADASHCLGAALSNAGRHAEAEAAFREGLQRKPEDARLLLGRAAALLKLKRSEEAEAVLEQALALAPTLGEVHFGLASVHLEHGRLDAALAAFRRAHELMPAHAGIHSGLVFVMNYSAAVPAEEIAAEHRRFGERQVQPVAPPPVDRAWPRRLRIGYISPDFRSHVVASFMLPILARHDRAAVDVFCYYLHRDVDAVTEGVRELADHWRHLAGLSDAEMAARIRDDRLDILVDLAGHSGDNCLTLLALRPAPVIATYLGYPNTTGLPGVQYRITDAKADPPGEADRLHTERLVRLPRSFLCYRPGPGLEVAAPPAAREGRITFGCFNNFLKLSPPFLAAAAKVLHAVPGSRLLLKDKPLGRAEVADAMRQRFAALGIGADRLVLKGWEASPEAHLRAYDAVDIALDSFPYNGTTTTCEALWMGVPVVTLRGTRHAGRVGASLLETVGLPELVAEGEGQYAAIAARLAADLPALAALRAGMRERLRRSPLLDEPGFVRELEDAYRRMFQEGRSAAQGALAEPALEALWSGSGETGRGAEAIQALGAAIAERGDSARYRYMLACACEDLGRLDDAAAAYRRALVLDPAHAKAANNLGCLQENAGDLEGAARSYDQALAASPTLAMALSNRGNLRKAQGRLREAEHDLRRAIELEPGHGEWHGNLGDCLALQWKLDEAERSARAGLDLDPGAARLHYSLGNILVRLGRPDEAEPCFRRALALEPDFHEAHSSLLLCLHYRHGDDPQRLLDEHRAWDERHARPIARLPARRVAPDERSRRPLRIGYVSPDFRGHSVAYFLAPLLAHHDRARFRVCCYSNVPQEDDVTAQLRQASDAWRDIRRMSDEAAARAIREDGIDVLVDLAGHSADGRLLLFARKPAAVQATWLGYPGTTGLGAMDYRITDAEADPEGEADRYASERLLRLQRPFVCFGPLAGSPGVAPPPLERAGRVTFGSFNNAAKLAPPMLEAWARILASVPGSRLVVKARALASERARRELGEAFLRRGIAGERLAILPPEESMAGHLARYAEVDIALDTHPYNGTTTTCEALWMGVPVVTLAGRSHVARVGASLLRGAGLEELVARSSEEYVALAAALAADGARLRAMREGMRARLQRSALLDAASFARAMEAAYERMWSAAA